jgi:hypothetical protein
MELFSENESVETEIVKMDRVEGLWEIHYFGNSGKK